MDTVNNFLVLATIKEKSYHFPVKVAYNREHSLYSLPEADRLDAVKSDIEKDECFAGTVETVVSFREVPHQIEFVIYV